jgi:hypothetical protein
MRAASGNQTPELFITRESYHDEQGAYQGQL